MIITKAKEAKLIKFISIFSLIGCIIGIITGTIGLIGDFSILSLLDKVAYIVFLSLYIYGVKLSIEYYRKNERYLFQFEIFTLLQVFSMKSSIITYQFSTGLNLFIYASFLDSGAQNYGFSLRLFDLYSFGFMKDTDELYFAFNLFAVLILIFINKFQDKKKKTVSQI